MHKEKRAYSTALLLFWLVACRPSSEPAVGNSEKKVPEGSTTLVARDDSYTLDEDTSFTAKIGVLVNDSGDELNAELVTPAGNGTVEIQADGIFTYRPAANFFGADSFTYRAGKGETWSSATVTLDILPVNDAPSITTATLYGGYQRGVTAYALPAGWSDVEGEAPTYLYRWTLDGNEIPVYGAVLPATYPTKGAVLQAFVTPFDGTGGGEEIASNTVTVANIAPEISGAAYSVNSDATLSGALPATDADGDTLMFMATEWPAHGTATVDSSGNFTYSPTLGYAGADQFSFRVSEGSVSEPETVSLTVNPVTLAAETPYRVSFVSGPLPDFACVRDGAFAIVSMTPVTGSTLAPNRTYDFEAVISYSVTVTDTIYLSAFNDLWVEHAASVAERVVVQPSDGCAQTTVTLHDVSTANTYSLELKLHSARRTNTQTGVTITYFTHGAPEVRIVGIDHPPGEPLALGANGLAKVRMQVAWKNVPDSWFGYAQNFNANFYASSGYAVHSHSGSTVVEASVAPGRCTSDFITIGMSITNGDWTYAMYDRTRLFFAILDLLPVYEEAAIQVTTSAVKNNALALWNCTQAQQAVTFSTDVPWLYPQAASAVIAPMAKMNVTYATDAQALAPGQHAGELRIHPSALAQNTLPVTLFATTGDYVVTPATFDWATEAIATPFEISAPGEDWLNYTFDLPFTVPVYGIPFSRLGVGIDGYVNFGQADLWPGVELLVSNADLQIFSGMIYVATLGEAPNRMFVVTWNNLEDYGDPLVSRSSQLIFFEGSESILVQYDTAQAGDEYRIAVGDGVHSTTWTPTAGSAYWLTPN